MSRLSLLSIPVDAISERDALMRIASFFKMEGKFHVATPNPEMLVEAQKNAEFRGVLQSTALNLPDGVGLVWAMRKVARPSWPWSNAGSTSTGRMPVLQRITGTDTMEKLCSIEARVCPPERIFLLGAAPGIAQQTAKVLKEKNRILKEVGFFAGSPHPEDEEDIVQRINAFSPTLLFVAFGAPAQDLWIARNLPKLRTVKVAMGVGGAFDFIIGKQKRAPQIMRKMGVEWLWRLIREPRRIGRIWRAVVVFPYLIFTAQR